MKVSWKAREENFYISKNRYLKMERVKTNVISIVECFRKEIHDDKFIPAQIHTRLYVWCFRKIDIIL